MIEDFKTKLLENIPLTNEEIGDMESRLNSFKAKITIILSFATVLVMVFVSFLIKDNFKTFKYYDYILFAMAGFALFGLGYLMGQLVLWYDTANWKKDKAAGKNELVGIIINRDKTEYGEYFTFAGANKNEKIRIKVAQEDYSRYAIGDRLSVIYLKFSKEALKINPMFTK